MAGLYEDLIVSYQQAGNIRKALQLQYFFDIWKGGRGSLNQIPAIVLKWHMRLQLGFPS